METRSHKKVQVVLKIQYVYMKVSKKRLLTKLIGSAVYEYTS